MDFVIPAKDSEIEVELEQHSSLLTSIFGEQPNRVTYRGKVVGTSDIDPPNSFRMTGDKSFPVRVIAISKITKLNGVAIERKAPIEYVPVQHIVKSSRNNNEYAVRQEMDGTCTCTCPGFGYRKTCSHIDSLKKNGTLK